MEYNTTIKRDGYNYVKTWKIFKKGTSEKSREQKCVYKIVLTLLPFKDNIEEICQKKIY